MYRLYHCNSTLQIILVLIFFETLFYFFPIKTLQLQRLFFMCRYENKQQVGQGEHWLRAGVQLVFRQRHEISRARWRHQVHLQERSRNPLDDCSWQGKVCFEG